MAQVTPTREQQVIIRCVESIMEDAGREAKALKTEYNKRSCAKLRFSSPKRSFEASDKASR